MNNVYEYGGIADVLLRLKIEKEIDGVHYAANEPYTFLKDVNIQFTYEQNDKQSNAKKPVMSFNSGRPSQLIITGLPLTKKIANLILTQNNTSYKRTRRERIFCTTDGELSINYDALPGSFFVYDASFNRVEANSYNSNIIKGNFLEEQEYLVFYQEELVGDKYSFEVPFYPYFALDIFMKGNTDKITNDVYMHFDAASLVSVPNFNIINGGILNTPLVFNLIYINQEEPIIVFEK